MTTPVTRLQFTDTAPLEAQLASALALPTYRLLGTRTWLSAQHSDFESVTQGWKLHVSARPSTLLVTLARALPVLVARRCSFKVARSIDVLREINSAGSPPGTVGKAVTVYPPQNEVREVASELADALAGFEGPRIRSDRKLRPDSPVYYRYGPIVARFRAQDNGEFEPVLTAPDGTVTSGIAGPSYTVPDWTSDPFSTSSPLAAAGPAAANGDGYPVRRLGGRYQVTSGISRAARGMICRAQDITTGRKVVIKQACSHIGEDTDGADIRDHLRNERRILEALSGLPGVPDFVDHFAHSDSEFLVVSDVGDLNLRQDVADFGTYSPSNRVERSLSRLAASVLSLLDAAHQRGVIVRDLAPKNIIVSESGDLRLIDFEISRLGDVQRYGWTPGFSVLGQRVDADATIEDDYFSLGATLAYAATGMEPICIDQNFACNVAKTLRVLADVQPNTDIVDVIAGLLDPDQQRRREAAAVIRRGSYASAGGRYLVLRSDSVESTAFGTGILADDVVDDVVRHTVRKLVGAVHELVRSAESYPRSTSAYLGSAGMGMELLHHRDGSGVPEALAELAEWTMKREPTLDRPRGLYFGNMGTAIFLAGVGCALRNDTFLEAGLEIVDREIAGPKDEDRDDHIHGLAGLGTGYLILHDLTADQNYVVSALHCAERIMSGQYRATDFDEFPDRRSAGIDVRYGFGHGLAGTAEFLLSCAVATGSTRLATAAHVRYTQVLKALAPLLATARTAAARPMSVSWCQGLAGIGTSLTRAVELGDSGAYLEAAEIIGQTSMTVASRVPLVTQCCGLAGIGEFMLDIVAVSDEQRSIFHSHARTIAHNILTRSGGSSRRPVFPDHSLMSSSYGWATGSAGVLSFFRRLQGNGDSRLWSSGWRLP